jgi:hypothetical protein
MNRHFFSEDEHVEANKQGRCHEVELLRKHMRTNLAQKKSGKTNLLQMFLDIHAHSTQSSIFTYAPQSQDSRSEVPKRFTRILDEMSDYFNYDKCSFSSEKYKWNCARLGVHRDHGLINSFTVESSCYGYE